MDPPPRPPRPPGRFSPSPTTPTGPVFLPASNAHARSESGESSDSGSSQYQQQSYSSPGHQSQHPPSRSQYPPRIPGMSTPIAGSGLTPSSTSGGSPNTSPNHRQSNPSPSSRRDGNKQGSFTASLTTSPPANKMSTAFSNSSTSSLHNFSRPSIAQVVSDRDAPARRNSPLNPGSTTNDPRSHKRNNSQGFFEPSLPTASLTSTAERTPSGGTLSPSHIAAQAAMQNQQQQQQSQQMAPPNQHMRKRSQTVPSPQGDITPNGNGGRNRPPTLPVVQAAPPRQNSGSPSTGGLPVPQYAQVAMSSPTATAAIAAGAAFPGRPGQLSPGLTSFMELDRDSSGKEKETKPKEKGERSKMKLFSKPRAIGISSYREGKDKDKPPPSPGKAPSIYSKSGVNASTTSLGESVGPFPSVYSMANSSTSTLVPSDRQKEEKEKGHRHHLFTRQKKYKDRPDEHALTLSSAASNSKPIDPAAPQSIYNFAPPSPGLSQGTFAKSVSGFDLRHGGRALREKKREEKAAASALDGRRGDDGTGTFGPPSNTSTNFPLPAGFDIGPLQGFGVSNMTPDDAWDFLKAKLLIVFEGEELRMPIEDLNRLVSIHLQRCVKAREPTTITEDLSDLLATGFYSLDQTLRGVSEGQLVRSLVDMWLFVFGVVLPYMQAVFLPLDLEFRGHGPIMTGGEASEFWGRELRSDMGPEAELEVRKMVLLVYRDTIILSRYDILKALFSRLSFESIQVPASPESASAPGGAGAGAGAGPVAANSGPGSIAAALGAGGPNRPSTSSSLGPSSAYGSFNSQGSTLRSSSSGGDGSGARSRATSNTSAPELPPFSPTNTTARTPEAREHVQALHSAAITETVGRMLQCMSMLSSLRSDDESQRRCEALTTALKLNWLGRGRTGRNRKGFVGARAPVRGAGVRVGG
jgi:HbrB-like